MNMAETLKLLQLEDDRFKLQKELEVYKKALELISDDCCNPYTEDNKADLIDYYLQKARGGNDS